MASRRAAAWLGLVLAGSLWALHRSRSEAAGAALVDAFGASEERQYNLQQLEEAPRRLKALPQSSHKARSAYAGDLGGGMRGGKAGEGRWRCTPTKDANHRVCEYSSLIVHRGTAYYLTDDHSLELPAVDVTYHPAPDEKYAPTVLHRSQAGFLLEGENEWFRVPLSWLWKVTKRWDNLAHHFGEDVVTLHNTLCRHLGECTYPPRREVQLFLLHSREQGALLAPVNATQARCVTGWPAVYRDDPRLESKTLLLEKAWSGIGPECHSQRGCASETEFGAIRKDKRAGMPAAALQSWRERLGACYGLDVHTPARVQGKTVLIVDRPYEAGRHMLNVRSVEKFVRERFPGDDVRLQYFEDVPFPDQLRIISGVSILVMVHGSAIALWPFLPPKAVAIHISPDIESAHSLQRVWAEAYARDWGFTGLTFVPLNNSDPSRQHMRWEVISKQDQYQQLSSKEKITLLETGECPEQLSQLCTFHWKRQELSLVVDLSHLGWALDTAEASLNLSSLIQDIGLLEGSRDLLSSRSARPLVRKAPLPPCAPLNCSVPVGEASPFADSCVRLQDVCLDQGRIILYESKYRPEGGNGPPIGLPDLVPDPQQTAFYLHYWRMGNADLKWGLPAVPTRPASATEPRQYLDQPSFSTCTVPVLFYQHNAFNFAHTFRDNAARFFSALRETPWAGHVKVLLQTGGGLAFSFMNLALWQPLSNMSVESLADSSVRLADDQARGHAAPAVSVAVGAGQLAWRCCLWHPCCCILLQLAAMHIGKRPVGRNQLPPSYEGTQQRCFKSMYVCLHDINTRTWQLHEYGQMLVRHYGGDALVLAMPQTQPPGQQGSTLLPPPVSVLKQLNKAPKGGSQKAAAAAEQVVRVVFQKRGGDPRLLTDRQLINSKELVERCNAWRYTAPSGARVRALCWEVELSTLEVGIAAAHQADIFIGAHGANIANAWLMRPGSAIVELTMFEFEENQPHLNLAERNMKDADSQVQFYKLLLCDPRGSWTPGWREGKERERGATEGESWSKYRNLVVRWPALRAVLEDIVKVGGDMQLYRQLFQDGRWWWLSSATQTVYAGPDLHMTCKTAREQGVIQ
ncbi:hypothetical protein CHLNCDRAFT_57085 [Chlorella variabilis]|uniref:Glycosyltransferase 61 catalytic domain-containing protein n=1 Tax=Chlorella variabilis TaxID=554065 RepID=E1Z7Z8_CHLVA|nr:hypothetical protein CHLNCDRAFT_57085 [Chlorella variabilis]EFN58009.1 hypothetical protein CHLNCDRAFT_57085 [Chlorella variabilis]|eukprot:XP_005850111.1 hypothetical protein CHLNCDRAFT_57085 [Chlorella variabilis]